MKAFFIWCTVYDSLMSKLINGVKVGGNAIDQAIIASNIKDANNKPMFDYYEYYPENKNSSIPNYKEGTIISLGYTEQQKEINPYLYTDYGHVLIETKINNINIDRNNTFLTEVNYNGNGEIRISDITDVKKKYINGLGKTYSYVGIAVPRG